MATAAFLAIVGRLPGLAHRRLLLGMILALALAGALAPAPAVAQGRPAPPAELKQITNDLYFFYEFAGSNAVFMVTDEGVLVIDTRQHPRDGQDLIDRIRKITDKPIKWVINSHFHGDHHLGDPPFKALGATFVAQRDTAALMQKTWPKEIARRQDRKSTRLNSSHYGLSRMPSSA